MLMNETHAKGKNGAKSFIPHILDNPDRPFRPARISIYGQSIHSWKITRPLTKRKYRSKYYLDTPDCSSSRQSIAGSGFDQQVDTTRCL